MSVSLTKDFINSLLYELAKKLNKVYKHQPVSITIVGGAAIILQSKCRDVTEDIDIVKDKLLDIKQSALEISEKFDLNNDWINDNFMYSKSFSKRYVKYMKPYKTIYNLSIYILDLKAIACMKMIAGRNGTNDISDIKNIIKETNLTKEESVQILSNLYGDDYKEKLNIDLDSVFGSSALSKMTNLAKSSMGISD